MSERLRSDRFSRYDAMVLGVGAAFVLGLALGPGSASAAQSQQIVSAKQASRQVTVADVKSDNGIVSGTLVNKSRDTVRNVRVMIDHAWLWKDEFHPGTNDPGRTDFYTIKKAIPPNSSVHFRYRTSPPLPHRTDGRFETRVKVDSFIQVG